MPAKKKKAKKKTSKKPRKLTKEELEAIRDKCEYEGFEYYFTGYCSPENHAGTILEAPHKKLIAAIEELRSIVYELE